MVAHGMDILLSPLRRGTEVGIQTATAPTTAKGSELPLLCAANRPIGKNRSSSLVAEDNCLRTEYLDFVNFYFVFSSSIRFIGFGGFPRLQVFDSRHVRKSIRLRTERNLSFLHNWANWEAFSSKTRLRSFEFDKSDPRRFRTEIMLSLTKLLTKVFSFRYASYREIERKSCC